MIRRLLCAALLVCGCAPRLSVRWTDLSSLGDLSDDQRRGAAAEVLLYREQHFLDYDGTTATTETLRTEIVKVLTEDGRKNGAMRLDLPPNATLTGLAARTISRDGATHEVHESDVIHDEARVNGQIAKLVVFQFPAVEVGSVLELSFSFRQPKLPWLLSGSCAQKDRPVKRCEIEIDSVPEVQGRMKTYFPASESVASEVSGSRVFRWVAEDIPAESREGFAPPPERRDPSWVYALQTIMWGGQTSGVLNGWSPTAGALTSQLHLGDASYLDGFDLKVSRDGCPGRACVVDRALALVRDRTDFSGLQEHPSVRPLRVVAAGGEANDWEKAVLLWRLLADAGVEAWLAPATRLHELDATLPAPVWFDHALVYLPPGSEGDAVWLDPSCEHCAANQLPPWDAGAQALVISTTSPTIGSAVRTQLIPVGGTVEPAAKITLREQIGVDAMGDARATITETRTGSAAVWECRRTRSQTEKERFEDVAKEIARRSPLARLRSVTADCDKAAGICRRKMEVDVPALATTTSDGTAIPLTLLSPHWDGALTSTKRNLPLRFAEAEEIVETVTVTLPGGGSCEWTAPASEKRSTEPIDSALTVTPASSEITVERLLRIRAGTFEREGYRSIRAATRSFGNLRQVILFCRHTP